MSNSIDRSKKVLVLDIDQTLIGGEYVGRKTEIDLAKTFRAEFKRLEYFYVCNNNYIIFVRPYIKDFLKFCFEHFNVMVWSAAAKDYVDDIVENLILPIGMPFEVLSRIDCYYNGREYMKFVNHIVTEFRVSPDNIIAIDDNPTAYNNFDNLLLIPPFSIYSMNTEKQKKILTIVQDKLLELKQLAVTEVEKKQWASKVFRRL